MKERKSVQTSLLGIAKKAQSDQKIALVLLRKRVFTKSPVRENRTPGSVRGLSGNWRPTAINFLLTPTAEMLSFFQQLTSISM